MKRKQKIQNDRILLEIDSVKRRNNKSSNLFYKTP